MLSLHVIPRVYACSLLTSQSIKLSLHVTHRVYAKRFTHDHFSKLALFCSFDRTHTITVFLHTICSTSLIGREATLIFTLFPKTALSTLGFPSGVTARLTVNVGQQGKALWA